MEIRPLQPREVEEPLRHVVERALAEGAPAASWMVADVPEDLWLAEATSRNPGERARAVVAAERETSLLQAQRLGFGGAVWLPASTSAMVTALAAAASGRRGQTVCADVSFLECLDPSTAPLWAVTCANRRFWTQQLGDLALSDAFAALADRLGAPRLVVPWPALLLAGGTEEDIHNAWQKLSAELGALPTQGLLVEQIDDVGGVGGGGIYPRLTDALSRAEVASSAQGRTDYGPPRAICALPGGEIVARWSPLPSAEPGGSDVFASPEPGDRGGIRWHLRRGNGEDRVVREVLLPRDLVGDRESVMRLTGWLTESLRPGTPAGLLVERFAEASKRSGINLWISNVDGPALKFLLRLGVPLWVDGPAVPG